MVIVPFLLRRLIASKWFLSQRFGRFLKPFALAGGFSLIEFLLSLAIWIAVGGVFFCVVKAISLPIGFGGIWLLISIQKGIKTAVSFFREPAVFFLKTAGIPLHRGSLRLFTISFREYSFLLNR